jgi:hypothetical protein
MQYAGDQNRFPACIDRKAAGMITTAFQHYSLPRYFCMIAAKSSPLLGGE